MTSTNMPDLRRASLGPVAVGDGIPVAVMGALNVSPESFYAGSIHTTHDALLRAADLMVEAGAALIDVGAMSTAPYLAAVITEDEERRRLADAVEILARKLPVPISADTARLGPALAAIEAGAAILNDVTGLADERVARIAAEHDVSLILMASPRAFRAPKEQEVHDPIGFVSGVLAHALDRVARAGIPAERVVLDPGIGFFLERPAERADWDARVVAGLRSLAPLGRPLCVAVSRKSFVGAVTRRTSPADRLAGSLAATAVAVLGGAAVVRAHDVRETVDAVRVAETLRAVTPP